MQIDAGAGRRQFAFLPLNDPRFVARQTGRDRILTMDVPTKDELIGDNDDLDARCVVKHFLGKTADEVYEMLAHG
jgi:hypothetical protein